VTTRLYVGNLPNGANEAILRMTFGQNGRVVTHAGVSVDPRTGKPTRFGYVDMATANDASAAIRDLDGSDLDGKLLSVGERPPKGMR
jgi:RNA recognition motif-containing protein